MQIYSPNNKPPEFIEDNFFKAIIYSDNVLIKSNYKFNEGNDALENKQDRKEQNNGALNLNNTLELFNIIANQQGINRFGISSKLNRSIRTIEKQIKAIKDLNLIELKNGKRFGGYYIKK